MDLVTLACEDGETHLFTFICVALGISHTKVLQNVLSLGVDISTEAFYSIFSLIQALEVFSIYRNTSLYIPFYPVVVAFSAGLGMHLNSLFYSC